MEAFMPLTFLSVQKWSVLIIITAVMFPLASGAQDHADLPDTVQVALAGFTLEPELTETGTPILDEAGAPVMQRITLDESVITPGDQVLYVITVANPTEEPAMNLRLGVQAAAEVLLDPYSLVGPEGLVLEWADADNPTYFRPVFGVVDGETVLEADLDELRALRLTLPELPPSDAFSVEYTVTLR